METAVKNTWRPITAGILNIITGALSAFSVIALIVTVIAVDTWTFIGSMVPAEEMPFVFSIINIILISLLLLSVMHTIFPILGGVFALRRRRWGWALAGSIVAIVALLPLGVASTIFVSLAKDEFG
jgi:hypothetical protein